MRVFAALPLPQAAAGALAAALEPVRARFPGIRWVNASGFHVTLHFFGEVEGARLDELQKVMADPGLRGPLITARLGAMGQFPERGAPRVLWVALEAGGEEARGRWEAFQQRIRPLGWQPDPRGFTPHITVGRAGREPPRAVDTTAFSAPASDFTFSELVLFESLPGKEGAVYRPLARAPFDGSAR